jgi:adenylylsulfate kinase
MTRELSYLRLLETEAVVARLTGVDDPYEPPSDPDLVLDGTRPVKDGAEKLDALLRERGLL